VAPNGGKRNRYRLVRSLSDPEEAALAVALRPEPKPRSDAYAKQKARRKGPVTWTPKLREVFEQRINPVGRFTLEELVEALSIKPELAYNYASRLTKLGALTREGKMGST
jgi:hypothetical protein